MSEIESCALCGHVMPYSPQGAVCVGCERREEAAVEDIDRVFLDPHLDGYVVELDGRRIGWVLNPSQRRWCAYTHAHGYMVAWRLRTRRAAVQALLERLAR